MRRLSVLCSGLLVACATPSHECADLLTACSDVRASEIAPLLDSDAIADCIAVTNDQDETACAAHSSCRGVCEAPVLPANEESLFGCWTDTAHARRICFGKAYVSASTSLHAYAWFDSIDPAATPTYSLEYETFEDYGAPGRMALYGFMNANACLSITTRADAIFTTNPLVTTDDCKIVNSDSLSTFLDRWARE